MATENKTKETFSFSKDVDGVKKTFRGEEVENGWIITIDKEWKEKDPLNDSEQYQFKSWKYISKDNPLDKLKKKKKTETEDNNESDIETMFSDIASAEGMLLVD